MLGLFDSGLGGLTVLRRVHESAPHADLFFFADQAHAPYGDRSPADLVRLMQQNLAWLDERRPEAIVMACNTSCAMGDTSGWPRVRAQILDLIDSAADAVERTGLRRIGVIATTATARSGAYGRHIYRRIPDARVVEIAAPALVPLVEAGKLTGDEPRAAVREVCDLLPHDVEAIVLACTHYPLLDDHFAEALGPSVLRIDPALVQAERAAALVRDGEGTGRIECFTNGDPARFAASLAELLPGIPVVAGYTEIEATISKASAVPET